MENNLYIGNLVSFVDTQYFVELKKVKENVLLYKINKRNYIDVTDIDEKDILNYIELNKDNKILFISNLPVYKIFVDEIIKWNFIINRIIIFNKK